MSYSNDYKYGMSQEKKVLKIIRHFWNKPNIEKTKDQYSTYDFEDENNFYELKSRKFPSYKFETTMIATGKFQTKKSQILLFDFTDGLYYIKYNPDEFANFTTQLYQSEDRIGMRGNNREYVFIPVNRLIRICEYKLECLI